MTDSTRPRATVRGLGDGRTGIWLPFNDRYEAKALPGSKWDPGLKCWTVPNMFAADAQRLAERLNGTAGKTTGGALPALAEAFLVVFRHAPAPLAAVVYKALAKVLHPDVGGDTKVMQSLTDAWSRFQK